ncbi:MAG: Crp/Fnr family transcriptional regulator [Pseudomonadota bacterium]|nr:Crp/Fnr family transcriptional regulator [Pseudomonadota bacterium]
MIELKYGSESKSPSMQDKAEARLLESFRSMSPRARHSLVDFASFLAIQEPGEVEKIARDPIPLPRPENESVIAAIRRLARTYPMLDKDSVFSTAASLMTQQVMGQREHEEIIDELEEVFRSRYERLTDSE